MSQIDFETLQVLFDENLPLRWDSVVVTNVEEVQTKPHPLLAPMHTVKFVDFVLPSLIIVRIPKTNDQVINPHSSEAVSSKGFCRDDGN